MEDDIFITNSSCNSYTVHNIVGEKAHQLNATEPSDMHSIY